MQSDDLGLVPVAWRYRVFLHDLTGEPTWSNWSLSKGPDNPGPYIGGRFEAEPLYDAAAIERLVAERDGAREALKPFAKYGELHAGQRPEFVEIGLWTYNSKGEPDGIELKSRDFFRARQSLGEP